MGGQSMTPRERFRAVMNFEPFDRLPVVEWAPWWTKTIDRWRGEGLPPDLEDYEINRHLGLEVYRQCWIRGTGQTCPEPERHGAGLVGTVEEYERLREHLYPWPIVDREWWERAAERQRSGEEVLWLTLEGFFWFPRTVLGIERHLYAFYDNAGLMHRINTDLAEYNLRVIEEVMRYATPDFMTFAEDMSYNHGPMLSKALFDEHMKPYYERVVPALKARGTIVIVDSDGDITGPAGWFAEAGCEGMLPLERQSGVDVARLRALYPRMRFIGAFDKMTMNRGEAAMRAEFERLLPVAAGGGLIAACDHQTPPGVSLEDYRLYLRLAREYAEKAGEASRGVTQHQMEGNKMTYSPLTRDEVASVIEGRSIAQRVPVILHFWIDKEDFGEKKGAVEAILAKYPEDIQAMGLRTPAVYDAPEDAPSYRWVNYDAPAEPCTSTGLDERGAISDWKQLDGIVADFPDPRYPGMTQDNPAPDGRYRLARWWFCYFERHWQLRGMTNALMDYYTDPDQVHRLFRALTDFYLVMIERAKVELGADGIFTSDDLGTQNGPFFGPEIFSKFYKPYYKELIDKAHSLGMHFWLHTCGNIEKFIPEFVKLGLDVIHPIQKYTMDEKRIARRNGKDICIWSGFDVQQTIPWGTVEEVREEVRFLMDTFARPEGRMLFTAGNAIKGDCPVSSLEALFDEAFRYGTEVVAQKKASGNGGK